MRTTFRKLVAVGSTAALLAGYSTIAQAADELVISSATPPQHIQTLTMSSFAEALIERSGK